MNTSKISYGKLIRYKLYFFQFEFQGIAFQVFEFHKSELNKC